MNEYQAIKEIFEGGEINVRKIILILSSIGLETSDLQLKRILVECLATLTRIEKLAMDELHGVIDPAKISQKNFKDLLEYVILKIEESAKPPSKYPTYFPAPPAPRFEIDENLSRRYPQ